MKDCNPGCRCLRCTGIETEFPFEKDLIEAGYDEATIDQLKREFYSRLCALFLGSAFTENNGDGTYTHTFLPTDPDNEILVVRGMILKSGI